MNDRVRWRDVGRGAACVTLALCLGAAALEHGGVNADEWQLIAVVISIASAACVLLRSRRHEASVPAIELALLTAIAAWMLLALVPLPYAIIATLSPHRALMASAAGTVTGADPFAWTALSVAPAATFERLLFVFPAMAVFVAAREMPLWWTRERAWLAVLPVVVVGLIEALIGIAQFNAGPFNASGAQSVSGTYVNRNHYAGLLELALPLTLTAAIALWSGSEGRGRSRHRHRNPRGERGLAPALQAGSLLLAAAILLAGVVTSLSRMGFMTTLVSVATVSMGWLLSRRQQGRRQTWLWSIPLVLPLAIVLLIATNGMVLRFADSANSGDISADGRMQIWRETLSLISAYPWTGAGLGTFEHALYPFRAALSTSAVDYAHNDYLQIFSELGIVGLLWTMALACVIAWRAAHAAFQRGSASWLGMGVLTSLLALALHSLVDFNLYVPANALALAWIAGVAVSPGLVSGDE